MTEEKKYFVIIDGNSIIHRAFHALPPLKRSDGQIVNAVYGFLLVLFKILKDFEPKYLVACFDRPEPTFRKKEFENYKAKRVKAPQELYDQIPLVKEVLGAFKVPIFEMAGFEGDDIIGTLSRLSVKEKKEIKNIIVSGDNDVFQLVNNDTSVYFLKKGVKDTVLCNEKEVTEKFGGLTPRQIIDYKALRGDASDNIPGVLGVGEKTAINLILKFGSMDKIFKEVENNNPEIKDSIKEKLIKEKKNAFLSLKLSEIIVDVPLKIKKIEDCEWKNYDKEEVVKSLLSFGFKSLISKIPHEQEMDGIAAKFKENEPEGKEATLRLL
ncbi:MAG: 5'-3' exonuclease H3TH domain-containing protein [Candidatus Pacebacteria bacterium]|nr:5'-3' exonuclease H3TH domain-containing protein [Candidatus Paceibacterota bacterium]